MMSGPASTWAPVLAALVAAAAWWLVVSRSARREPTPDSRPARSGADERKGALLRYGGMMAAVIAWIASDQPGLAVAVLAVSQGAFLMLRAARRSRWRAEQERHAADAIGAASRALRAGIPTTGMLEFLAAQSRGEAQRAFREIMRRESVGEELGSAVRRVLLQSPVAALRAFGLTLMVQLTAGGNMADTTDRLAQCLTERDRVRRRARTIVAYSRTAAWVLAVMPLLAVPLMCWLVEGYADAILHTRPGNIMLGLSAIMAAAGLVSIQRLARIDAPDRGAAA